MLLYFDECLSNYIFFDLCSNRKMAQTKRKEREVEPHLQLSVTETVVLLNARANSHEPGTSRAPVHYDEVGLQKCNHYKLNMRKKEAYELLQKWKTPGFMFPFGIAEDFCVDIFRKEVAKKLGFHDQAEAVYKLHRPGECPKHCMALVHPGQEIPDCSSVAMIFATSECMSNYSAVIATAPSSSPVGSGPFHPAFPSSSLIDDEFINIFR